MKQIYSDELDYPLISIIVPVYNVKKFIERCVKSIEKQTYPNIEIILVDDGSSDGSSDICDRLSMSYENIRVIHLENSGVSAARNAGMDVMHGEFVGFVDADDYIEPDMYSFLYNTIKKTQADIACCAYDEHYSDKILPYMGEKFHDVVEISESIYRILANVQWMVWNKLFSNNICKKLKI